MKKFFNRFSTAEKGSVGVGGGVDMATKKSRVESESMPEKVVLQENSSPFNKQRVISSGERVKALAARYETLNAAESNIDALPLPPTRTSSHRFSQVRKERSPLIYDDKQLPAISRNASDHLATKATTTVIAPSRTADNDDARISTSSPSPRGLPSESSDLQLHLTPQISNDGRSTSVIGGLSSGHRVEVQQQQQQQQINPKQVAFAPSPKKSVRPSSPPPFIFSAPAHDDHVPTSPQTYSGVGNFAKPTLASTARAKNASKHSSSEVDTMSSLAVCLPLGSSISPPPATRSTSSLGSSRPQARRSNSSTTPGRRGNALDSTLPNISHPTLSPTYSLPSSNAGAGNAMSSSISLTHGAGDTYSHLPNSIPFVSNLANAHLRSASPQSIATNNSSIPNQSKSMIDSRRGSWTSRVNSNGSTSQGWASNGAKSIGGPSWSEMTQEDLVSNLGVRERTRQEVLWEIVASEERYVKELEKTKELYLDALLHPMRISIPKSPDINIAAGNRTGNGNHLERNDDLPIAARFMDSDYNMSSDKDIGDIAKPATSRQSSTDGVPKSSAVATKEQARPKGNPKTKRWSNSRLGGFNGNAASSQIGYGITEGLGLSVPLPASLKTSLAAIYDGLLEGHSLLSEALKQRYEEQWPLVRSLADVFSRYSYVFDYYKDYVIHLERALDSLEEAALMERATRGKRFKKDKLTMTVGLGRAVASLESSASERGECSLSIFLAMPFQRLLKYPLLFQNLLFHTDASTYEFESTVKMVVDVEQMVRLIEDEKADKEERDKTIDAFARIEGIKDKGLLRPKRDRLVIEERALYEENPRRAISDTNDGSEVANSGTNQGYSSHHAAAAAAASGTLKANLRSKRSYRRLSDFLSTEPSQSSKAPKMGSKKDIWLVRFSDVELKCQRVGVTALPMLSSAVLQQIPRDGRVQDDQIDNSMTEEEAKIKEDFKRTKESKERMKALRNTTLRSKTRNLYKFLSITSWKQVQKKEGLEDDGVDGLATPHEVDEGEEEEDDEEDDDNDAEDDKSSNASQETDGGMLDNERYIRQSKLSFSYWGHDKVEPKPIVATPVPSQYSSSVSAFRSRDIVTPPMGAARRHSYTVPGSTTNGSSPQVKHTPSSTKVVASNAHARSKADKFGSRLRQNNDSLVMSGPNRSASHRISGTSKTSLVNGSGDVRSSVTQEDAPQSLRPTSSIQSRPSFLRDQSVDSNMKLLGSLVNSTSNQSNTSNTPSWL